MPCSGSSALHGVNPNLKKKKRWRIIAKLEFVQSVEEDDNAEFSMINPNLLDLDLEVSDVVSNVHNNC